MIRYFKNFGPRRYIVRSCNLRNYYKVFFSYNNLYVSWLIGMNPSQIFYLPVERALVVSQDV